jgi:hypothetical protein
MPTPIVMRRRGRYVAAGHLAPSITDRGERVSYSLKTMGVTVSYSLKTMGLRPRSPDICPVLAVGAG